MSEFWYRLPETGQLLSFYGKTRAEADIGLDIDGWDMTDGWTAVDTPAARYLLNSGGYGYGIWSTLGEAIAEAQRAFPDESYEVVKVSTEQVFKSA